MKKRYSNQTKLNASLAFVLFLLLGPWMLAQVNQAPEPAKNVKYAQISESDLKEWLTYIASDEMQGRQVFTEGYGMAASYVAEKLRQWGVKPVNPDGTFFQPVKLKGYKVTRNSTVTIDAGGQQKTFKHGDHVTFAANSGGKQTLTYTGAEFLGYGLQSDLQGRDLKGKLAITIPNLNPQAAAAAFAAGGRGGGGGRGSATGAGATAAITFVPAPPAPTPAEQALAQAEAALAQANAAVTQAQQALRGRGAAGRGGFPGAGGGRGGAPAVQADVTTVQKVDNLITPQFSGDETFFDAVFADSSIKFADIKAKAEKGEAMAPMSINARVTITIDNTFEVVNQQLTHNVIGMIEGSDPVLKDTYVMFGAHLDHIGYSQTGGGRGGDPSGCRRRSPEAQTAVTAAGKVVQRPPTPAAGAAAAGGGRGAAPAPNPLPIDQRDVINNGADDDGSGSTALLGVAKAFATGPKPKRSVVFVWHTGEESGLYGSRYNADFPFIPSDKVQVQLNMDMVGRDDCDNIEGDFSNSVFLVGADRISTDLHNLIVQTNVTKQKPLALDYELNEIGRAHV